MHTKTWVAANRSALFVASAVGSRDALVIAAAGGVRGAGALALVVLFVPGALHGAITVLPHADAAMQDRSAHLDALAS